MARIKKVVITGGAGYVGCVLVPKLLDAGYEVVVYDLMYYGDAGLPRHPRLTVIQADIRDTARFAAALDGGAVIHLACISNDPSFELDPQLGKSINYDCFEPLVKACRKAGVNRFIYASSSSVYGVSQSPEVAETHPLAPLTDYSKYKALCEDILRRYQAPDFCTVIVRPATVCGYSPRMRLDLSVNILTNHAVNNGRITVFGGSQKRPNLHIADMADLYLRLLEYPAGRIAGETFNAGYQNYTIAELAEMTRQVVEAEMPEKAPLSIVTSPTADMRSYHVSSEKIARQLGFRPQRRVEEAIRDLCQAFKAGKIPDSLTDPRYYNVRIMKGFGAAKPA